MTDQPPVIYVTKAQIRAARAIIARGRRPVTDALRRIAAAGRP